MTATATMPAVHRDGPDRRLRIARVAKECSVLGPGVRQVVWVQGCALRCRGCVVPESHDRYSGMALSPDALVEQLVNGPPAHGITFSGGEPFLQARGLLDAARLLRQERPSWTFMSYTGYRLEVLQTRGTPTQRAFLDELDLLVDGPFIRRLAASLLWRGSSNQRIHTLTDHGLDALVGREDHSAGIESAITADGQLTWDGVALDGFRNHLDQALARQGLIADHFPTDPAAPDATETDHDRSDT